MNSGAGLRLDDVDPALGCPGDDVISQGSEYGHAGGMFRVLRCLFGGDSRIDFFVLGWWRAKRGGGEDSFDRFG